MRSYTHIAGAILLFISFAYLINLNYLWIGILFASWISVFPDILDRLLNHHRGLGHSILWIIPCLLVGFWSITIAAALVMGLISHILLDSLTTHGCPILYPFWKTNFVILSEKRRIKTGTNQDKAVFLAIVFLLIPVLFFAIQSFHNSNNSPFDLSTAFASNGINESKILSNNTTDSVKNNFNINLQLKEKTNKNISVKKVNDNETDFLVKDIEPGG